MTALDALIREKDNVTKQLNECFTDSWVVKDSHKYRYQLLLRQIKLLDNSIETLNEIKRGGFSK